MIVGNIVKFCHPDMTSLLHSEKSQLLMLLSEEMHSTESIDAETCIAVRELITPPR